MVKADTLRQLHHGSSILVLPNAWDVASALIFERAGFPALATTSAGVAFTRGYSDGQHIPRSEMIEAIARIADAVKIPVTADVEAGYDDAAETARQVWKAGAVGMNLEDFANDRLMEVADQAVIIRAVRSAAPEMVINARTDIFLNQIGEEGTRFDRTLERLNVYLDAGADCVFAPGVRDRETIARLAKAVRGPLNILAVPGAPPVKDLQKMGVARVSVGSGPMRATLGLVERIARELHDQGTYESMTDGAMPYAEINQMFASKA